MKHNPAPVPGAAPRAPVGNAIPSLARSLGLVFVLLAAPSVSLAQVMVSVFATHDTASETPPEAGEFAVRRVGGDPDQPATIAYFVTGSASPGDDYATLSGSVSLGAGEPEADIAVAVPGDDDVFEGSETVTITLAAEEGVVVVDASATVTIQDSPYPVTVSSVANASENPVSAGRMSVSLGARNESGATLTVNYSVGGSATPGAQRQRQHSRRRECGDDRCHAG